jgi:hypothetical protein
VGAFFRLIFCCLEGLFASKPAPTGLAVFTNFVFDANLCGSGLAREEARHIAIEIMPIANRPCA